MYFFFFLWGEIKILNSNYQFLQVVLCKNIITKVELHALKCTKYACY